MAAERLPNVIVFMKSAAKPTPGRIKCLNAALAGAMFLQAFISIPVTAGTPAAAAAGKPIQDKWALIIGISNYRDRSMNLRLPAKDARDFQEFLVKEGNFAPDHVKLLINEEATRENIFSALGDKWLPRAAHPNDLVVIYISAHGSPSDVDAGGVNYIVAHDTSKDSLFSTGIPMQDLVRIVKSRVHSDRIVLILDACHSGAATPDGKGIFKKGNVDAEKLATGTGQLVLSSSTPDQISWESRQQLNSVFTRHLIDGLRHKGASTKLGEAYDYLREKVEQEVLTDRGTMQTPVMRMKWQGNDLAMLSQPSQPRSAPPDLMALSKVETVTRMPVTPQAGPSVQAAPPRSISAPPANNKQERKVSPPADTSSTTLWSSYMEAAREQAALGHYAGACTMFANAQKESETFSAKDPKRVQTLQEYGEALFETGKLTEAEPVLWRAVRAVETSPEDTSTSNRLAPLLAKLASIQLKNGKPDEAKKLAQEAMLSKNGISPDKCYLAAGLEVIGLANLQQSKTADAEFYLKQALKLREADSSADARQLYSNLTALTEVLIQSGKLQEAESVAQKAMQLGESTPRVNISERADCLECYSRILKAVGKSSEAHKYEYKAKMMRSKTRERQ